MLWNQIKRLQSCNENVSKYVFEKEDAVAESVLYKYPTYKDRTVICCSTQVGCPIGCRFCGAGDYFVRNLTTEEIVSQPVKLLEDIDCSPGEINKLQIMFMSMGEPLLNYKNLSPALYELEKRFPQAKLLISTIGPKGNEVYRQLMIDSEQINNIGLQFSIHESTDQKRNYLIPIKGKLSLQEIAAYGVNWYGMTGRKPFFNYCVHDKNNTEQDVENLCRLFNFEIWNATISVICERDEHVAAANERQRNLAADFMSKMLEKGYDTRMFDPAGQDDIGGGCGQLWFVQDWMRNHPEKAKKSVGYGLPIIHTPTILGK